MIGRWIFPNLRRPQGFLGRLVGNLMAHGNEYEAEWTVQMLNIQPDDHILEIGFGPGVAIGFAARKAVRGRVAGVDYSQIMVDAARKRNRAAVQAGLVELQHGDVSSLHYPDDSFDKAYTIHCLYFWDCPIERLKELRRTLKPNGLLAVTILPKERWSPNRTPPPDLFTLYQSDEVAALLSEAGFRHVRVEICPQTDKFSGASILGVK